LGERDDGGGGDGANFAETSEYSLISFYNPAYYEDIRKLLETDISKYG